MSETDRVDCPGCGKSLAPTGSGKYRHHLPPGSKRSCDYGGTVIPCPSPSDSETATSDQGASSVKSSSDGVETSPAEPATSSTPSSLEAPASPSSASTDAPASLPGVDAYAQTLAAKVTEQTDTYRARVDAYWEARQTQGAFAQPSPSQYEEDTLFSQPVGPVTFEPQEGAVAKPPPPAFSHPVGRRSEQPAIEMTDLGKELAGRLRELFYSYDNRRSSDNRSAQATMGPSEMGTPCDRRLALSLMRMPAVNPGGDGWAAFVGTCIHAGLEQMFMWADAGTGRFAVEQRLEFDHEIVPKGTADLIDRTLFMLDDHKCQGRWSRNKLKSQGPSKTYRVQAHVYAKGARARGEKIEHVAIFSWPRDESTLDDLYVWTEPYNPAIADAAFERVDDIAAEVSRETDVLKGIYPDAEELEIKARVGLRFPIVDDCRFCPFYLPNAASPLDGCNGKR